LLVVVLCRQLCQLYRGKLIVTFVL
jgi:hypothetical protein